MNSKMLAVMQRRGELLAKIAAQREQMAEIGTRWQAPLALADQGMAAVRFLRSHPALVVGVVALFVIRRRGVVGLVKGGWRVWKGYSFLTALAEKLLSRNLESVSAGFIPRGMKPAETDSKFRDGRCL